MASDEDHNLGERDYALDPIQYGAKAEKIDTSLYSADDVSASWYRPDDVSPSTGVYTFFEGKEGDGEESGLDRALDWLKGYQSGTVALLVYGSAVACAGVLVRCLWMNVVSG